MHVTTAKENSTAHSRSQPSKPFFSKGEENGFSVQVEESPQPFFAPAVSRQSGTVSNSNTAIFQPKLTFNEPGDQYEQEADIMADRVMRMSAPVSEGGDESMVQTNPLNINAIQRKCAACEQEEKLQRQEMEEEEETVQTAPLMRKASDGGNTASPQLASQLDSSKGGGDPLPDQTLGFMNQAFGTDFSKVRVHTGSQAAEMSQGMQAKAFTHGSDIYFNRGQYSPESSEGKRLLGHELTHVVQQEKGLKRIARAVFKVGNNRIQIDYGNVVDINIKQYQNQIELWYSSYTGQPATGIQPMIATLTDAQKRWLLYAIDLLHDNPIPSFNKTVALQRLIEYAPNAQYSAQEASFNYENEVLRVSGWFERALTSGLTMPTAKEQELLDFAYSHAAGASSTSKSGASCPVKRIQTLDEKQLRSDLPPQVRTFLKSQVIALANNGIKTKNMGDILPIADLVQQQALQTFAPYIGRGSLSHFLQKYRFASNITASTATGAIAPEARKAYLENRANGLATDNGLFQKVNYDPRCLADKLVFEDIVNQLNNDTSVQSDLSAIMSWQSFTARDQSGAKTTLNLQYFSTINDCVARWLTVNTLCHELLHAYVHPNFYAMNKGRRIVTEGFTEVLGDQLYEVIRDKANKDKSGSYRSLFEGGLAAGVCQGVTIPPARTDYGDDGLFASKIRVIVGDDRFRAAYFLGQNLLAGLRPKLQTGSQDDNDEREADTIAEQIVNIPVAAPALVRNSIDNSKMVQRQPEQQSPHDQAIVADAKRRLAELEPLVAALEGRKISIEAERLSVLSDRYRLDTNAAELVILQKLKTEEYQIANLNRAPLDVVVTGKEVVFNVKFHVRFEDPAMKQKFNALKTNVQAGIDLVWKQKLGGVLTGRSFTIMPSFTLIDNNTSRNKDYWLITVRRVDTGATVIYPGCNLPQPDPGLAVSITDPMCDGGVMSIPPVHINKPGVLGHEILHLFGLIDRYLMITNIKPGQPSKVDTIPTRETRGRRDPLGGENGRILREDLGYIFDKFGVYTQEKNRSTAGLAGLKLEMMRLKEIVRLGYDPHSLIPSVIRKDFSDKILKDMENL